jgi:ribosomal protein S18 acetylase RimI-like enzyme
MTVIYAQEQGLTAEDYVAVVSETTMRNVRPLANPARVAQMLAGSNLIATARDADGIILGLARCMSDTAWICYCSDLAVKESAQGRGVGRGLLDKCTELLGPRIGLVLVSYPESASFYDGIGMERAQAHYRARTDSR